MHWKERLWTVWECIATSHVFLEVLVWNGRLMISKSNFGFSGRNNILDLIFLTKNEINNITRGTSK